MNKENKEKNQRNTRFSMHQEGFKRNSNFRFFKRKSCRFCDSGKNPNFIDFEFLKKFTTEQGKILPKRITGTCSKHQRNLATEIKKARHMALLAFTKKR